MHSPDGAALRGRHPFATAKPPILTALALSFAPRLASDR